MKYINDEKGFTLVELLIALAILAVGLLGLAGMQINAIRANAFANKLSAAVAVAQGVMENTLARPATDALFHNGDIVDATDCDIDPSSTVSNTLSIDGVGTMTARYSIDLNSPAANVATISVTVTITVVNNATNGTLQKNITITSYKGTV